MSYRASMMPGRSLAWRYDIPETWLRKSKGPRAHVMENLALQSMPGKGSPRQMGVSENSVPLNPMVLLIITPIKWLFHWEY